MLAPSCQMNRDGRDKPGHDAGSEGVFLEFSAPTWPNGFDIAPDWLFREMELAGELTRAS
jgi:hypothetical protein